MFVAPKDLIGLFYYETDTASAHVGHRLSDYFAANSTWL